MTFRLLLVGGVDKRDMFRRKKKAVFFFELATF